MDNSAKNFRSVQYIKNISSNIALLIINILISLWYTPFLIRNLGSELFGFIPLANSVTRFFSILTLSLNISTGRYFTIELEKGDNSRANQIFNTTFLGTLVLTTLATPLGIILVYFVPTIFTVPLSQERQVQWLFLATIIAFFITTLRLNFSVATYAKNRFDLGNIVSLLARFGQIAIVVILFYLYPPSLLQVGIGILTAALLSIIGDFYLWKILLPQVHLDLNSFRVKFLHLLIGTSSWILLYQIGVLLLLNIDMLVANRTLSLGLAGMFGALLVIPKNLRILANAVGGVWGPTILSKYSRSDFLGMDKVVLFSVKLIGLTLALPIGYLIGLAEPFLVIWLGAEYGNLSWILILMIFHLSVSFIFAPFLNIQVSLNKVKYPALFSMALGVANYFLTVQFSLRFGLLGIVMIGALMQSVKSFLFMPIYSARIMKLDWWHYLVRLIPIILATLGVSLASYFAGEIHPVTTFRDLFLIGLLISGVYTAVIYFFGFSKEEKNMITSLFRKNTIRG